MALTERLSFIARKTQEEAIQTLPVPCPEELVRAAKREISALQRAMSSTRLSTRLPQQPLKTTSPSPDQI